MLLTNSKPVWKTQYQLQSMHYSISLLITALFPIPRASSPRLVTSPQTVTNLASLKKSRAWILPWVCLIFISVSQMGSGNGLPEGKHQSLMSSGSTSSTICSTNSRWTPVAVSLAAIPPADILPENGFMHAIAMLFLEGHVTVPPPPVPTCFLPSPTQ